MKPITVLLEHLRQIVRHGMRHVAQWLNVLSGGHLTPNQVTLVGLGAHLPIAWLVAQQHYWIAAGLLVVFGLFDTLDGELARLQKRAGSAGMLLDASTDRFKEVLLYTGAAYSFVGLGRPYMSAWAVAACGASLCVSYVKAKGETAVVDSRLTPNQVNRLFQDGLMRFEVRMGVFIVGLLSERLIPAVILIALSSSWTALQRLMVITRKLQA